MTSYTMTINGKGFDSQSTFDVIDPAAGSPFAACPECTKTQLDEAMEASWKAFASWSRDKVKRINMLRECAAALRENRETLATLLTREQGKPLKDTLSEIDLSVSWFETTASFDLPVKIIQDNEKGLIEVTYKPLGVIAAITPWNVPVLLAVWKIAPALLAGNTIVVKPSPFTPLTTLKMGEIFRDILPRGVLNIVSGGDELGAWMTVHPAVRKISFTGSIETGKIVAKAAAPDLKRFTLELGGNDPAIVLPDVDPHGVAPKIFWGAFRNNGQICIAIKRLYVHEKIYMPLLEELRQIAGSVKIGNGLEPETQLGPMNNLPQLNRVIELVEDAQKNGGRIVIGGERLDRPGYFYPPTLVTDICEGVRLVDEEQFGPALPVMPFKNVDEALERANSTHYGLGGSVWTGDVEKGAALVAQLDCGAGWVNQHIGLSPFAPFGGVKWSGIGYQNGLWGLEDMTEMQVINISR